MPLSAGETTIHARAIARSSRPSRPICVNESVPNRTIFVLARSVVLQVVASFLLSSLAIIFHVVCNMTDLQKIQNSVRRSQALTIPCQRSLNAVASSLPLTKSLFCEQGKQVATTRCCTKSDTNAPKLSSPISPPELVPRGGCVALQRRH